MKPLNLILLGAAAYFLLRKKSQPAPPPELEATPIPSLLPGPSIMTKTAPRARRQIPSTTSQSRSRSTIEKVQTPIPGLTVIKNPGAPGLKFGKGRAGMTRGFIEIG